MSKLSWSCRRGAKELDELLQRYLRNRYAWAEPGEQRAFERLLELPDPLLQDYFMGASRPEDLDLINVVQRVLES